MKRISHNYEGEFLVSKIPPLIEALSKAREDFGKMHPYGPPSIPLSDYETSQYEDLYERLERELISCVSPLKSFVSMHKSRSLYLAALLKVKPTQP